LDSITAHDIRILHAIQLESPEKRDLYGPTAIHDGGQSVGLKLAYFGALQVSDGFARQVGCKGIA